MLTLRMFIALWRARTRLRQQWRAIRIVAGDLLGLVGVSGRESRAVVREFG